MLEEGARACKGEQCCKRVARDAEEISVGRGCQGIERSAELENIGRECRYEQCWKRIQGLTSLLRVTTHGFLKAGFWM